MPNILSKPVIAQTQTSQPASNNWLDYLPPYLKTGNTLWLVCAIAAFAILSMSSGNSKKRAATGQFSQGREKASAKRQAKKQIKAKARNSVGLYIGREHLLENLGIAPIYLPDAQRGTAVCGGPGSGKTFSVIDPAVRSAIRQGFPIILYDFKYPSQTSRIAGYAQEQGYEVRVFAPGYPESDVCNPLDFLRDNTDSLMARQMAEVLNKNFSTGSSNKSEDPFFTQAADQLTEGIFLLAKSTDYPDIMMCQSILSMNNLAGLLRANKDKLDPWVYASFGQLVSVEDSEKTAASIVATAASNFTRFIKKDILAAFCSETTIPLDLKGKQLLVMGLDRERRDVVAPLLATVLHMIVSRNVSKQRNDPLVLALDELPTLYLPSLVQWLNENREDGLVTLLGFQNLAQLEQKYGEELSRAILGGCASKAIFNPQEQKSAQMFSDFLGEEEIRYKQRSRGSSDGKGNVNIADQDKTRKLFESSRFLKLKTGHCILINPGYSNAKESAIPVLQVIKLPWGEMKAIEKSQEIWKELQKELQRNRKGKPPEKKELIDRYEAADKLFDKKPEKKGQEKSPVDTDKIDAVLQQRAETNGTT
jgi:type IV secretory pathway TraG/TraD family ATPase VirD4